MFAALRELFTRHPNARVIAFLGVAHVLRSVEVRDGVAGRDGREFTVPTLTAIELIRQWGVSSYSVILGGVDPAGLTDPFSRALHDAGERKFGILPLEGTSAGAQRGLVRLGSWYKSAERARLSEIADAIVYFPTLTLDQ
jgi:hypothetical protein